MSYEAQCSEILYRATNLGVQFEVLESAFKHKEQFPNSSLLECLQVGADEWDV